MAQITISHLVKQLHWPLVVFTLLVFAGLIKLGFWQSERAQEKSLRIEKMKSLTKQQAMSLEQVLQLAGNENINDFPVVIEGEFDQQKLFLLDNQTHKGQLGYRVLQVVNQGQYAVLINLGWVLGSIDRQTLPDIKPITGKHSFKGHVRKIELGVMLQEQDFSSVSWPLRIQQIELDKLSHLLQVKLVDFVVYIDQEEKIGYKKNWQPIVMPPEKHQAYAFQWFSLAVAWLVLMVWALVKSNKNNQLKA